MSNFTEPEFFINCDEGRLCVRVRHLAYSKALFNLTRVSFFFSILALDG